MSAGAVLSIRPGARRHRLRRRAGRPENGARCLEVRVPARMWPRPSVAEVRDPPVVLALVGKAAVQDAVVKDEGVARPHGLSAAARLFVATQRLRRDLVAALVEQVVARQPRGTPVVGKTMRADR